MAKIDKLDILKLNKKQSRDEAIRQGTNLISYRRVHKSKKAYDRKQNKKFSLAD